MLHSCKCPPTEGLSFDEIIETFGLLKRKEESKNCCENLGYICSELDNVMRKAYNKRYQEKKRHNDSSSPTPVLQKIKRKRKLSLF